MSQNNGPSTGNEMILSPRQEKLVALRDEMAPGYRPAAIVPRTFAEIELMCKALAGANLVPKAFKDKPTDMILVVMTGLEVGIPPMAALRLYTTWDGVPRLMAEGIRGVLLAHPDIEYFEPETGDDKHATWVGKRRGRPEKKATWTIERAKRADLLGKDNWRKYPEDMLNARASMQLGRMIAPDIMAGMVSREEASDGDFIDAQATETRSAPAFVAPPPTNGGSGGGVLIVGSTTPGFVTAPPEVTKQFPQVAAQPAVVNIAPVGSPNAQSATVAPQGPPPGVPQPPPEKPKRERGAAAVRPTSAQPSSAGSTAPAASSATSPTSSAASTAPASPPSGPAPDAQIVKDMWGQPIGTLNPTPPASSTSPSPSVESAQTSSPASGAAPPLAAALGPEIADALRRVDADFGGEDPVDTPAAPDPVEAKLAEFHAWLKGCANQRDLVGGLAAWRAWSKDMSDTHGDLRFRKGGEITIAMQDAYSKRKGEVPA